MDRFEMRNEREQSPGALLLHYQAGAKQLDREAENWQSVSGAMQRMLKLERQG